MIILHSKPIVDARRKNLKDKTDALIQGGERPPSLAVVLIGEDPSSKVYVKNKFVIAKSLGFDCQIHEFKGSESPERVFKVVREMNDDPKIDGIIIQRPLPKPFKPEEVMLWVDPEKDVDCLHPENIGLMVTQYPRFLPCTPAGILLLLDYYQLSTGGKISCVIGRSNIVGKPLSSLLISKNSTVIQIHRSTPNPEFLCKQADFVFVAAGSRHLVNEDWIKPGAVVIDVGIHRDSTGKITGDVDQKAVESKASAMTPVPGGVGPMTIQVLMENTFFARMNKGR